MICWPQGLDTAKEVKLTQAQRDLTVELLTQHMAQLQRQHRVARELDNMTAERHLDSRMQAVADSLKAIVTKD